MFVQDAVFLVIVAILHWRGVIVAEFWVPKWLTDAVPDLPDMERF
jgi:hypothetical protein